MNKTETYPALEIQSISLHLGWSSISVEVGQVDGIQLLLSGDDDTVQGLHLTHENNTLRLELPIRERVPNLIGTQWMQTVLRLPASWRGAMDITTTHGNISLQGVCGSDLHLESISGSLRLNCVEGIHVNLTTISGSLLLENLHADSLRIHSISGMAHMTGLEIARIRLSMVSGGAECAFSKPFQQMSGNSVSASLRLIVPSQVLNAVLTSVSGRLLTDHISIHESGPELRFTSVTGNLAIECDSTSTTESETIPITQIKE